MVGLIEGATYSNTREHHSMLYTDTLGPIFAALEQEFALQLIADLDPSGEVYCEANIAEKLQGDFVDQTTAISSAVGAPWMTRSEARAIMNLPHDPDGDDLVVPLNVIVGGQASPRDSAPPPKSVPALKRADGRGHRAAKITAGLSGALAGVYRDWGRVAGGTLGRGGTPGEIDQGQLAGRYSDAARPHLVAAAHAGAQAVIDRYGGDPIAEDRFDGWAATTAERAAGGAASSYVGRIGAAIVAGAAWSDAVDQTTEDYTARADTAADSLTTPADSVGRSDAAESTGLRYKVWTVTSANPRASHAALDGEAVPLYEAFSNGAQWPGDTEALDIDETAGCTCQLDFAQEGP
jgi:hypothetical protein